MTANKLFSGFLATGVCFSATAQNPKPNIVFILADDLGWSDLGCTGSDFYETPNIDKLRNAGMLFTRAYTNAANSAPSRASILTGLYTPRHGVYTVNPPDRGKPENRKLIPMPNKDILDTSFVTFPEILRANGYRTIHIGKWHLGTDEDQTGPLANGFDVNIAGNHIGTPHSYYYPFCNQAGKCLPNLNLSDSTYRYLTDRLTQEAVTHIKQNKDRPFFLYLAHYAVHTPIQAKTEKVEKYRQKPAGKHHNNTTYAAMIESLDESVGSIIETLKEENLLEKTLIVFLSDNGGMLDGITDNSPLRGGKGMPYEGGNRVPFIVSYGNKIAKNSTSDVPVMGADLFPTFLDFANIKQKSPTDGKSLKSVLTKGKSSKISKRNIYCYFPAYLESYGDENSFRATPFSSVISGDWKLIHFFEDNRSELYNLKNDIGETTDLSKINTKQTRKLTGKLQKWMNRVNAPTHFQKNPLYLNKN